MTLQHFRNWLSQPELMIVVPANRVTLGGIIMAPTANCQWNERNERRALVALRAERQCSNLSTSNPTLYQFLRNTTVDDMMELSHDMPVYEETLLELWFEARDTVGSCADQRLSSNVAFAWETIEQKRAKATTIK